jgi:hypothetical protein
METDCEKVVDVAKMQRMSECFGKKEMWKRKRIAGEIVDEIVNMVEARASVDAILKEMLEITLREGVLNEIWKLLETNEKLQSGLLERIAAQKAENRKQADGRYKICFPQAGEIGKEETCRRKLEFEENR